MARKRDSPSKWWFWGTVILGNIYLAIGFILPAFWSPRGALLDALMLLYFPGRVMLEFFVEPVLNLLADVGLLSLHAGELGLAVGTVALSEIGVLLAGLLVHGTAGLFAQRRGTSRQRGDMTGG